MKTKVVNFVSGAGCGKSLMAALTFAELKMKHLKVEYVQEYAKTLVWQKRFDELNNQYYVSTKQYNMIKAVDKQVEYIVCDTSLLLGIYYNKANKMNICDTHKTNDMILNKLNEFDNIYILLKRNTDFPFEKEGRIQNEEEAVSSDIEFKKILDSLHIQYLEILSSKDSIKEIISYILNQ